MTTETKYRRFDEPHILNVVLFRLQVVEVKASGMYPFPQLAERIFFSGEFELLPEVLEIARRYKTRHLVYLRPNSPLPLPSKLNDISEDEFVQLPELFSTASCADNVLPSDGSCINMLIEEPWPIERLLNNLEMAAEDEEDDMEESDLFYGREIVLFLLQYKAEVFPKSAVRSAVPGFVEDRTHPIWCKLVKQAESQVFQTLAELGSSSHHVATLLFQPFPIPSSERVMITMPHYGLDLTKVLNSRLNGLVIYEIARQLCDAVHFLHTNSYYHFDIKPENISLAENSTEITLIDLGWVTKVPPHKLYRGACGTDGWSAPEVQRWHNYAQDDEAEEPPFYRPRKVDVWAIGNVVEYLLDRSPGRVVYHRQLTTFAEWLMMSEETKRPNVDRALSWLDEVSAPPSPPATPHPSHNRTDSDMSQSLLPSPLPLISAC